MTTAGNLSKDASRVPIQTANSFVTADATGTPNTSPLTVSGSVIPLLVPTNAYAVILLATGANDVRVSNKSDASTYWVLFHGQPPLQIGCAEMTALYVIRDANSDASLNFAFLLI